MKKMLALLLATSLTAAALSGCGSSKTDSGAGTTPAATAATEKTGESSGAAAEAPLSAEIP